VAYDDGVNETIEQALEAERALGEKLAANVGEWVAVANHEVIDHDVSVEDLLERVGTSGAVFRVLPPGTIWA
jgi:hypothetical protein